MHSMKNTDITPENLASQLKSVHKSSLTKLGNAIETAARLRRSSPSRRSYNDHEWNEQLGHGYTRAQQAQGSFKSSLNSNKAALVRYFEESVPYLLKVNWHATINQCIEVLSQYSISQQELEDVVRKHQPVLRDKNGLTDEEAEIWAAYSPDHSGHGKHPELNRLTRMVENTTLRKAARH